ncbi:PTS glucose transporter subunit IIB [Mesomycoplasma conjunctivae]|uniref:PTS glucose transporter subunit IIB n=1 Tax=Mesomycoplasma conjunctivae TaxID=45361 RepID=UPI003DA65180
MRIFSRFIYKLLQIITFGKYAKIIDKKYNKNNEKIVYNEQIPFKIEQLIKLLGGNKNIKNTSFTISRVKIEVVNLKDVDLEGLKNLKGVSGVVAGEEKINLIVGDTSKIISLTLKEAINNHIK